MIDNGRRVAVTIRGVFDGQAGESDGIIAFIPRGPAPRIVHGICEGQLGIFYSIDGKCALPFAAYRFEVAA